MRPEPHSGMVRSFSHLPQAATAAQQGARRPQSTAPPRARHADDIVKQNAASPQAPPSDPQSHKAFNQWLDRWNEKSIEAAEKQRPDGHVELERRKLVSWPLERVLFCLEELARVSRLGASSTPNTRRS